MVASNKVIITIAPTGGQASKHQNSHLPTQPDEIARDVYQCYNAGASVVAVHARRPDDLATCNSETYRSINAAIREKCDIVINNSTGGGSTGDMVVGSDDEGWAIDFAERLKGIYAGAEMCTLDPFTTVASLQGKELLVQTSPNQTREMAQKMHEAGIKPEFEVFAAPHILQDCQAIIDAGLDEAPHYFNIVLGMHKGFQGTMPYSPRFLQQMVDLLPPNNIFGVSGMNAAQLPAAMNSLLLGGHVRVGLEDNLLYRKGEPATNVQLVERLVRLVLEMGFEPATAAEAREILGLPLKNAAVTPEFAVVA